jgi:PGF-pre-PGF domain-containing protein
LRDFFNWNDNQSGTLHLTSTNLKNVKSSNNYYSAAVFSGCFPAGRNGDVEIQNNNLKSLDISNDPGLLYLNASFNSLNQTAVDGILQTLDFYNTNGGYLDLTGNAVPSITGISHANNLTTRNWEVKISSKNNPPVANFTSNVTFGMVPLAVQFYDTSKNNPTTWLWDFGDGTYSTKEFPEHIYTSPGDYTVTLEVRSSDGSDFKVVVITVLEQSVLPLANFSSNVTEGSVPLDVQFNDLSENTEERYWNFGDGTNSTQQNPTHTYSVEGNYSVNLTVSNANGTASKTATINVLQAASLISDWNISNGSSSSGSINGGGSGGGSGGGGGSSPELLDNIDSKELSKAFVASGNYVKFDFPMNATPVVYIAFDAKKTPGKTTTIVEMLNKKSTLVSELPSGEIYKFLNIWAGNNGFIIPENIENAVVYFKVERSWIKDRNIDQFSITLNRYSNKKWDQLPTSLSEEDNKYLYFIAQTPGFSPFSITGKTIATGTEIQPEPNTENIEKKNGSTAANVKPASEKQQSLNISGEKSTEMPGFATVFGIVCLNIVLLACFLYFFSRNKGR